MKKTGNNHPLLEIELSKGFTLADENDPIYSEGWFVMSTVGDEIERIEQEEREQQEQDKQQQEQDKQQREQPDGSQTGSTTS